MPLFRRRNADNPDPDPFLADELRFVLPEPGERIVEAVHREHDTQIAQRVHRSVPVIGDHRRREKA